MSLKCTVSLDPTLDLEALSQTPCSLCPTDRGGD
jgi:hypothetical protein